jgi:hypothetical protein
MVLSCSPRTKPQVVDLRPELLFPVAAVAHALRPREQTGQRTAV